MGPKDSLAQSDYHKRISKRLSYWSQAEGSGPISLFQFPNKNYDKGSKEFSLLHGDN